MLMQLKPDRHGSERDVHSLMSAEGVRVMGSRVQASPGQGRKVRTPPPPRACVPGPKGVPSQKLGTVENRCDTPSSSPVPQMGQTD